MGLLDPPGLTKAAGDRRYLARPAGRVVSTRSNRLVNGRLTNTDGLGKTYKIRHYFPQACGNLQLWYANVYANGWGETPNTNPLTVRGAVVKSDGTVVQATFGGKLSLYLPSGSILAAPSAPTLTAGTSGALAASGAYWVVVTYINPAGETTASAATQVTVGATTPSILVTAPAPVAGATGYNVYCGLASGANTGPFYLAAAGRGFAENTLIANAPTAVLPQPPTLNTTAAPALTNSGTTPLIVASDPIPVDVAAGDYAYTVTHVNTAAPGQFIPVGTGTWGGTLSTGEGNAGGDLTGNHASIPANNATGYSPYIITGLPDDPSRPCVAIIGDSIPEGTGDPFLGPGDPGYVITGLGGNYPYAWLAKGSELTTDFMNQSGSNKQRRLVRGIAMSHCNVGLGNYGTNDVGAGSSAATIKANLLTIWSAMKRRGMRVYWSTLTPRTRSLDGWRTAGPGNGTTTGQWFYENVSWGANGGTLSAQETIRQQVNQWLRAPKSAGAGNSALFDAAGTLDGIVDTGLTVEVNSDGSAITTNGSTGAVNGLGGGYWTVSGASTTSASGTATGGSTSTVIDSGQTWTTNQWSGYMVTITSGTGAGQAAQVASNTATTLTLNNSVTTAIGSGATYQLYRGYAQDGIHPAKPAHTLMAAPVAAWATAL